MERVNNGLEIYRNQIADYLGEHMKYSEPEIAEAMKQYEEMMPVAYSKNLSIATVATMIYNEL